ncbi:hypothetical protein U1Q18_014941 [Sarracenia purpurea var. burkii]
MKKLCDLIWIAGGGDRGAVDNLEGLFEDIRQRKSVITPAVLHLLYTEASRSVIGDKTFRRRYRRWLPTQTPLI